MVNFFLHLLPLIYSIFVCVDPNPTKLLNIRLQFGSGFTTLLQTLVNRDSCNYLFGWPEPWGLTSQVDRSHYQHLRWKNCENQSGPAVTGRAFKLYRYKYKFYFSHLFYRTRRKTRCKSRRTCWKCSPSASSSEVCWFLVCSVPDPYNFPGSGSISKDWLDPDPTKPLKSRK